MSSNQTKYSFWQLITEYNIEIPMIQRDYAQGRVKEKRVSTIRNEILSSIFNVLIQPESEMERPLDFDFIYGKIEDTIEGRKKIIPIDGQQRLTTLFLLHWYLRKVDGENEEEIKEILNRFSYKTRKSSTEFCKSLVKNTIVIENNQKLSEVIKDSSWFFKTWEKDPTVSGMLVMLDSIHIKFKGHRSLCWHRLIRSEKPLITFQFNPMENLKLDDNIYIRMNSRGRALTEFENFKARFEKFLEETHSEEIRNRFSKSIDREWTDFLWNIVNPKPIPRGQEIKLIDQPFLYLFDYISELIFYRNINSAYENINFSDFKEDDSWWKRLYKNYDSIDYLFKVFGTLLSWGDCNHIFKSINDKTSLFEVKPNLIKSCIIGDAFDWSQKILLYFVIESENSVFLNGNAEELYYRIRVLRNLLSRIRQFNWPKYNSNLRYTDMYNCLIFVNQLVLLDQGVYEWLLQVPVITAFSEESKKYEIDKAKIINDNPQLLTVIHQIEDDVRFMGSIHAILSGLNDLDKLKSYYDLLNNILDSDEKLLITVCLFTISKEHRYLIRGGTNLGKRYFFCLDDWYDFLTQTKPMLPLISFLNKYIENSDNDKSVKETLGLIKEEWLRCDENRDFSNHRYYFIKYPQFMLRKSTELFVFSEEKSNFEIERLRPTYQKVTGKHINPFVNTVIKKVKNDIFDDCNGYDSGVSYIVLKNSVEIWSEEDSWGIVIPDKVKEKLSDSLISFLGNPDHDGAYRMKETDEKDRIEVAVDFINKLTEELGNSQE